MKYKKGSYAIVPNTNAIKGLEPLAVAVYVRLCVMADSNGQCFPGQTRLANDADMSIASVKRKIKLLEEKGLLKKINRYKENSKEMMSNFYQIMVVDK